MDRPRLWFRIQRTEDVDIVQNNLKCSLMCSLVLGLAHVEDTLGHLLMLIFCVNAADLFFSQDGQILSILSHVLIHFTSEYMTCIGSLLSSICKMCRMCFNGNNLNLTIGSSFVIKLSPSKTHLHIVSVVTSKQYSCTLHSYSISIPIRWSQLQRCIPTVWLKNIQQHQRILPSQTVIADHSLMHINMCFLSYSSRFRCSRNTIYVVDWMFCSRKKSNRQLGIQQQISPLLSMCQLHADKLVSNAVSDYSFCIFTFGSSPVIQPSPHASYCLYFLIFRKWDT